MAGAVSSNVAGSLESGGRYLQEHGLRANYYNSRHFDKSVVERTARQVDFDRR
jgi:hypothetical protein